MIKGIREESQKPEARSQKPEEKAKLENESQKPEEKSKANPPDGGVSFLTAVRTAKGVVFDFSSGFFLLVSCFAFSSGFWLLASGFWLVFSSP